MEHRLALRRNMAQSLIEHGQVETTLPKAKNLRPFVERLVTLGIKVRRCAAARDEVGSLRARRRLSRLLGERSLIPAEHREAYEGMTDTARAKSLRMVSGRRYRTGEPKGKLAFTGESILHRLIETVAPRYADRPGGYTRVIRLGKRRVGDHSPLAIVQLIGDEDAPTSLTKPAPSARKRRADARYAMAVKLSKGRKGERRPKDQAAKPASEDSMPADGAASDGGES
jgi:large subunit ribosomal protein L17